MVLLREHKKHLEKKLKSQSKKKNLLIGEVIKMKTFREDLNELLKKEEFRKEWELLRPEFEIARALIKARKEKNLTQKEIAERSGINQADISKIENGSRNPTIQLLQRLAEGLDMKLELKFVPKDNK